MALSSFSHVKVKSICTTVPSNITSIIDEIDQYGGNLKQIKRIQRSIGLDKRHVVNQDQTTLDLALNSAHKILDKFKGDRDKVDGLIFVTQTPDHHQPSNAAIAHGKLGLSQKAAAFDIGLGCSGYVYGMWMAHMMIASGAHQKILLLAGDTLSKCVNPRDRATAPLFGDAGSATLLEADPTRDKKTYFSLHTDGSGYESIIIPSGGSRNPIDDTSFKEVCDEQGNWRSAKDLYMNGGEVFNFAIKVEPAAVNEILDYSSLSKEDIDHFVFHQANKYIITNIAKRLKIPIEKVPCDIVGKYGNQSSASIPCTINDALVMSDNENKRVLMSGFGVGLSWASAIIELDHVFAPPVYILN